MRYEASVTSISWIPSEAVSAGARVPFDVGLAHYDAPPPDRLDDLEALRLADRFRFANELKAYIEVEDGRITGYGQLGGGHVYVTALRLAGRELKIPAVKLPELRPEPEVSESSVRFVQSVGARTGVSGPRPIPRPPFVRIASPLVWTTLALTLNTDGSSTYEVVSASPFPRHWVYDQEGKLAQKSGMTDFTHWVLDAFEAHSPWGDQDAPALMTAAETELERELSGSLMKGRPKIRKVGRGEALVEQGQAGDDLYLLLDGVMEVEVDGKVVAEVGPGAILGERAILEGGRRTATLRALTPCRVAQGTGEQFAAADLAQVASGHRREEG